MDDKLNVCLLNDSFCPCVDGVVNVIRNYAENITDRFGKASIVTPKYPGVADMYSYNVIRYPSVNSQRFFGYRAGNPFTPGVLSTLEKQNFTLIHSHCPFASGYLARLLRQRTGKPLVFTYHTKFDYDIRRVLKTAPLRAYSMRLILSNISACDEVWTVSRGASDNLHSLGYEGDCIVMKNGVDLLKGRSAPDAVSELKSKHNIPDGIPVFLFVGRIQWYKGVKLIFDGLDILNCKNLDFRMIFVGAGTEEKEIKAYCQKKKLTDKCIFAGIVRDRELIKRYFSLSDLFLFPSLFDTNGIVVREASACALPSVLIRGSCAAEDITDFENGFLIDNSPKSLALLLQNIMDNKSLIQRVGKNAQNTLYISWHDAVNFAVDRYNIVIEKAQRMKSKGTLPKQDKKFIVGADRLLRGMSDVKELTVNFYRTKFKA